MTIIFIVKINIFHQHCSIFCIAKILHFFFFVCDNDCFSIEIARYGIPPANECADHCAEVMSSVYAKGQQFISSKRMKEMQLKMWRYALPSGARARCAEESYHEYPLLFHWLRYETSSAVSFYEGEENGSERGKTRNWYYQWWLKVLSRCGQELGILLLEISACICMVAADSEMNIAV